MDQNLFYINNLTIPYLPYTLPMWSLFYPMLNEKLLLLRHLLHYTKSNNITSIFSDLNSCQIIIVQSIAVLLRWNWHKIRSLEIYNLVFIAKFIQLFHNHHKSIWEPLYYSQNISWAHLYNFLSLSSLQVNTNLISVFICYFFQNISHEQGHRTPFVSRYIFI